MTLALREAVGGVENEIRQTFARFVKNAKAKLSKFEDELENVEEDSKRECRTVLGALERIWGTERTEGFCLTLPNGRTVYGSFEASWEELETALFEVEGNLRKLFPGKSTTGSWTIKNPELICFERCWDMIVAKYREILRKEQVPISQKPLASFAALRKNFRELLSTAKPQKTSETLIKKQARMMFPSVASNALLLIIKSSTLPELEAKEQETEMSSKHRIGFGQLMLTAKDIKAYQNRFLERSKLQKVHSFKQLDSLPGLIRKDLKQQIGKVCLYPGQKYAFVPVNGLGEKPIVDFLESIEKSIPVKISETNPAGFIVEASPSHEKVTLLFRALHADWAKCSNEFGLSPKQAIASGFIVDFPMKPIELASLPSDKETKKKMEDIMKRVGLRQMRPHKPPRFPYHELKESFHNFHAVIVLDDHSDMLKEEHWQHSKFLLRKFIETQAKTLFGNNGSLTIITSSDSRKLHRFDDWNEIEEVKAWIARLQTKIRASPKDSLLQYFGESELEVPIHVLTGRGNAVEQEIQCASSFLNVIVIHPHSKINQFDGFLVNADHAERQQENLEEITEKYKKELFEYERAYKEEAEEIENENAMLMNATKEEHEAWIAVRHKEFAASKTHKEDERRKLCTWRWQILGYVAKKRKAIAMLNEFLAVASAVKTKRNRESAEAVCETVTHILELTMVEVSKRKVCAAVQTKKTVELVVNRKKDMTYELVKVHFGFFGVLPKEVAPERVLNSWKFASDEWEITGRQSHLRKLENWRRRCEAARERWRETASEQGVKTELQELEAFAASIRKMRNELKTSIARFFAGKEKVSRLLLQPGAFSRGLEGFVERNMVLTAARFVLEKMNDIQEELECRRHHNEEEKEDKLLSNLEIMRKVFQKLPEDEFNQELARVFAARRGIFGGKSAKRDLACFSSLERKRAENERLRLELLLDIEEAECMADVFNASIKLQILQVQGKHLQTFDSMMLKMKIRMKDEMEELVQRECLEPIAQANARAKPFKKRADAARQELRLLEAFRMRIKKRRLKSVHRSGPSTQSLKRDIAVTFSSI